MLDRDSLLNHQTLKTKTITVDEWGGDLIITELSAQDTFDLIAGNRGTAHDEQSALMLERCLVDASGNRILEEGDGMLLLKKKSWSSLDKVLRECQELNGLNDPEEQEKKSPIVSGHDSSGDLQSNSDEQKPNFSAVSAVQN